MIDYVRRWKQVKAMHQIQKQIPQRPPVKTPEDHRTPSGKVLPY